MNRKFVVAPSLFLLFFSIVFVLSGSPAEGALLAGGDAPAPVLVLPAEQQTSPQQRIAADELKEYIRKICAVMPIEEGNDAKGFRIILTDLSNTARDWSIPSKIAERLSQSRSNDAFYLKTLSNSALLIAGKNPRSLVYGACFFLNKYLGVRWFYPGEQGECVPKAEKILLPDTIDDFQEPFTDFRVAAYTVHDKKDVPWTPDDIVRWQYHNLVFILPRENQAQKYRAIANVELRGGGHLSLCSAVPSELFASHPEYFPLLDGKRVQCSCLQNKKAGDEKKLPWVQRCVSHPDVKKRMVDHILQAVKANPEGTLGLGAADVPKAWCRCTECDKLGTFNGTYSVSNLYYTFYKQVTDEVLRHAPYAKLWIYIYLDYRDLPSDPDLTFDPRVTAIYYAHGRCIAHPINDPDCEINRPFLKTYHDFAQVFSRVGLCDYYGNSNTPFCPNEYNYAADAPERIRCKDWGEREHITASRYFENWPFYYAKAVFWWNPRTDIDELMDDLDEKYYQKAAAPMKEFRKIKRRLWQNAPGHAWYPGPRRGAYCLALPESEKSMRDNLDSALRLADGDKTLVSRILMEKDAFEKTWVADAAKIRADLAAKRVIPTRRIREKIRIDGKLDERVWGKIEPVTRFISPYTKNDLRERTLLRVLHDEENFYVSIECMNDKASTPLKFAKRPRDDGRVAAEDDSIELFLCTPGDGLYYQFMVNPAASYCDAKMLDKGFDSQCEVAATVIDDRYIVEMRIPVAPLGFQRIEDGDLWRMHVWRNIRNLQAPETVDRGGIDGHRPHQPQFYRPLVPGGREILQNGDFRRRNEKGFPESWGVSSPENFSYAEKDGHPYLSLRVCKIYQYLRLSDTGHNAVKGLPPCRIDVTIHAAGTGKLELIPSTGIPGDPERPFHRMRPMLTSELTPEIKEHHFSFDLQENEQAYIYIGARNADIYQASVIKTPQ